MGVSTVAVVAFLSMAGVGWLALVSEAREEAKAEARDAQLRDEVREATRQQTVIRFDSHTYSSGPKRLTIAMTNTGDANLDAGEVDVLLDGVWKTSDITSTKVDNFNSVVWSPDTQLVLIIQNVASNPARDVLVTEEGVVAVYER